MMPRMDGITATKHIRALNCRARNIPIIAMTANVLSDQVASYRAAGMNDFVGKPFKRAELYRVIARWTMSMPPVEAPTIQEVDRRPAFDQAVYDELREFLEPAELAKLVGAFAIELDSRLPPGALDTMDRAQRARTAHAMISAAGSLGFSELSALCAQLERTSVEGGEARALIRAVEEARERASAVLRNLQRAA